jgi:hypothetical protein
VLGDLLTRFDPRVRIIVRLSCERPHSIEKRLSPFGCAGRSDLFGE